MDGELYLVAIVGGLFAGVSDGGVATLDGQRFLGVGIVGEGQLVVVLEPLGDRHEGWSGRHGSDGMNVRLRVDVLGGEVVGVAHCHLIFPHILDG